MSLVRNLREHRFNYIDSSVFLYFIFCLENENLMHLFGNSILVSFGFGILE